MTNARLRYDGLRTTLGAALTNSGTTITFAAALTHDAGTAVPTIAGGNFIMFAIIDPQSGALAEIVKLTAYTAGATTGTIARGQEGTTGVAHNVGDIAANVPTVADFGQWTSWSPTVTAETGTLTTAAATVAQYLDMGDIVFYNVTITITTVGSGAGGLRFTTPSNISADSVQMGHGRETQSTGAILQVHRIGTALAQIYRYENATMLASGRTASVAGFYKKG